MATGVGQQIGGYRIERAIGEGGMALAYLATRLEDGREVVLKVLREELSRDEGFRKRFLRESRYAAQLEHPNIVPVHGAGDEGGVLYIVMEYVPGTDLYALLQAGPLEPKRALAVANQVGAALDAAHEIGLLHRDVKPGNVLIAPGQGSHGAPHCYLTDFGLSQQRDKDSVALTATGDFVGTIYYTAPEQMLGRELDGRADLYSLACLLYECLAGEPPFTGGSEVEVMQAHIESPPPKLSTARPELPWGVDDTLGRAMAKDPRERHGSCREFVEEARAAFGAMDLPAVADGAGPPTGSDKLRLKVTAGNALGTEIVVQDELLIGREAEGEGKLADDIEISRQHAKITRQGDEFVIDDLGSRNGTAVNGRRLTGPERLYTGDTIELGGTKLVVQVRVPTTPSATEEVTDDGDTIVPETTTAPEPPVAEEGPPPRLSLRLDVDLASGEARLALDESSEPVRIVHEDGRWQVRRDA